MEAGSRHRQVGARFVLAGRAFMCPKQRFTSVANGYQRSAAMAPELCPPCRWAVDGASQACGAHRGWAAPGPRMIGNPWSSADNSGKQSRRSEPMPANRRRSRYRPSDSLKATVRGSGPWRRTGHLPITTIAHHEPSRVTIGLGGCRGRGSGGAGWPGHRYPQNRQPPGGDGSVPAGGQASAVKARSQAANALRALVVTAPAELREQLRACPLAGWPARRRGCAQGRS
jgi:hypothetical protein